MCPMFMMFPLIVLAICNLPIRAVRKHVTFPLALSLPVILAIAVFIPWIPYNRSLCGIFLFSLSLDGLAKLMILTISIVAFSVIMASRSLIGDGGKRHSFINLVLVAVAGMNGVVLVRDIFSMYVFLEITAVSSFIMVAFSREMDSLEGAYKYFVFSALASVLMLASIALLLMYANDTSFIEIGGAVRGATYSPLVVAATALFLGAFFMKAGLMPFHWWVPDAYSAAPNSASVFLAGIITKAAGVYPLIRLVPTVFIFNFNVASVLMFFGALSAVLAAFAAFTQSDIKRMLAYSSISQIGYIVLSLGCGTALGFAGAVFHFFNHAVFKSTLFLNAAAVESKTSLRDIGKMGGLAQKMPVTGVTSALACLSTAGVPPLSGFWSKIIIIIALWMSGNRAYAVIAVLASLVTLAYMLALQRKVFFGKPGQELAGVREADVFLVLPAVMLTLIMLAVSVMFPWLLNTIFIPIGGI